MVRWRSRGLCLVAAFGLLGGPARAAPPSCPLDQEQREAIRDHNTKAKQDFEEEKYLLAAKEWLAAQAVVPAEAGCADQRATRVDLALRSLGSYGEQLRYEPADAELLAGVVPALRAYAEGLPEGERRATILARAGELECVRAALPDRDAALDCTPAGRASKPEPVAPTPAPEPESKPEPAPVVAPAPAPEDPGAARRRRGLAIGFGVSVGLGAGALAAGLATWASARMGGPQHRAIRDAAADSVADDDPGDDVPPNLPPDQDYCAVARAGGRNPTIADLCDRHDRTAAASIASFTLAGVFAAASVTLAALWGRAPRPSRQAARSWRVDVAPTRGGATIGGTLRF